MTPTSELRTSLRTLLVDSVTPYIFTDDELDLILQAVNNIYEGAYIGWIQKAGKLVSQFDRIQTLSIGAETISFSSPGDIIAYCMNIANNYRQLAKDYGEGSKAFGLETPTFEGIE